MDTRRGNQAIYSGGSRGGARGTRPVPLFLDQTEARGAEKNISGERAPPYLKVWIHHWFTFTWNCLAQFAKYKPLFFLIGAELRQKITYHFSY